MEGKAFTMASRSMFVPVQFSVFSFIMPRGITHKKFIAGKFQFGAELGLHNFDLRAGISRPSKSISSSSSGCPDSGSSPTRRISDRMATHMSPEMEPVSALPLRCTAL